MAPMRHAATALMRSGTIRKSQPPGPLTPKESRRVSRSSSPLKLDPPVFVVVVVVVAVMVVGNVDGGTVVSVVVGNGVVVSEVVAV